MNLEAYEIRLANLSDILGICEVHKSHIAAWQTHPATWEKLSPLEQVLQGGAWVHPETCRIHIESLLKHGHYPVVCVNKYGEILGEAEFLYSQEPEPYGNILHLSVLYVHAQKQSQGIGSILIAYGKKLAQKLSCSFLTTQPEKNYEQFYIKKGFKPWLELVEIQLELEAPSHPLSYIQTSVQNLSSAVLSKLPLRCGRYQCLAQDLGFLLHPHEVPVYKNRCAGVYACEKTQTYFIYKRQWYDSTQADGLAIAPLSYPLEELLVRLQTLGKRLGFQHIDTLISTQELSRLPKKFPYGVQDFYQLFCAKITA